ncbi:hypothetical protein D5R89_19780 [Vibrio cholerae]|nr:hypothetical protein D5R89_19780 [Vibrio cholerae]
MAHWMRNGFVYGHYGDPLQRDKLANRRYLDRENKGTKARKARARLKVLESVKNELIAASSVSDPAAMMRIFITPPKT